MAEPLRILMATWDGAGNNPPIRSLAAALVARGDQVFVAGHGSTRHGFEDAGCTFLEWESSSQPPFIREYVPLEEEYAYVAEHVFFGRTYQTDFRPLIDQLDPDVLMVDVNLRYGILEGLRATQPVVVLCHILYGATAFFKDSASPYYPELRQAAVDAGVADFESRREMLELADRVLVFSYASYDPLHGDEAGERIVHVGPLRAAQTGSTWPRRYPERKSVLVALSTSDQNQGALLQRICDACARIEVEALVTTGQAVDPRALETAGNVTAVEFMVHDDVLPHMDLLVTHAGHGTVVAGLANGVPMLCIPLGRDQHFNADRIEDLALGAQLDSEASTDQIATAMQGLLDSDDAGARSRAFASSLRSHPGISHALSAIDELIAQP